MKSGYKVVEKSRWKQVMKVPNRSTRIVVCRGATTTVVWLKIIIIIIILNSVERQTAYDNEDTITAMSWRNRSRRSTERSRKYNNHVNQTTRDECTAKYNSNIADDRCEKAAVRRSVLQ